MNGTASELKASAGNFANNAFSPTCACANGRTFIRNCTTLSMISARSSSTKAMQPPRHPSLHPRRFNRTCRLPGRAKYLQSGRQSAAVRVPRLCAVCARRTAEKADQERRQAAAETKIKPTAMDCRRRNRRNLPTLCAHRGWHRSGVDLPTRPALLQTHPSESTLAAERCKRPGGRDCYPSRTGSAASQSRLRQYQRQRCHRNFHPLGVGGGESVAVTQST